MDALKQKYVFAIISACIWMNVSEFVRNELILKKYWIDGFQNIGLIFPSAPINGIIWGLWALIFVICLTWLITKFSVLKSTIISWILGFTLLWIAMWNMNILPAGILYLAIPWSFIEVFLASLIIQFFLNRNI